MWLQTQGVLGFLSLLQYFTSTYSLPADLESRIVNGTVVTWDNPRWQVSLRQKTRDGKETYHLCGGSLISPNQVLTASHCMYDYAYLKYRNPKKMIVSVGSLHISKQIDALNFTIREVYTAPGFDPDTFKDDVAVLVLNQSIPENYTRAMEIELNEDPQIPIGTKCTVTGWGVTENRTFSANLRIVEVPIVNHTICAQNYKGKWQIMDGMLCAGYLDLGERDACNGDSGGPLVCDNKVAGIVSFGEQCAKAKYPGVYTNVAKYVKWIRNPSTSPKGNDGGKNSASFAYSESSIFVIIPLLSFILKIAMN
ncbi:trypsin eta-like [Haematobia irritans]|uniref:Putative trypsin-like serine protease n=1 Tax=Haematobia irritans TaxID=7368 RepID=A0A1L8EJA9_HAEIR